MTAPPAPRSKRSIAVTRILVGELGDSLLVTYSVEQDAVVLERLDGVDPTGFVLGVTEEPAGGSDSPTLPILAST